MNFYTILRIGVLLWLLQSPMPSYGQSSEPASIALGYDDVSVGRNINIVYRKPINNKWALYGGLKYHLNSENFKHDYNVRAQYFKEFEANSFKHRMGLKLGLEHLLYSPNNKMSLFAFWDVQYTNGRINTYYLQTWHKDSLPADIGSGSNTFYSFENTIGLGLRVKMNNRLRFRLQAGFGFNYYWSYDMYLKGQPANLYLSGTRRLPLPPSRMMSAGIEYALGGSKKKTEQLSDPALQQQYVQIAYNNVQIGRNYSATYHRLILPHTYIYGGVKIHLNSKAFVDYRRIYDSYYFKQFKAENIAQHIGLKAGVEQHFLIPKSNVSLFGFYDLQVSRATVRNLDWFNTFSSGITRANIIMTYDLDDYGANYRVCKPVTAIENYIGLGTRMGLSDKMNLKVQAGLGYNVYAHPGVYAPYTIEYNAIEIEDYTNIKFDAPRSELSKMFSIGVEYGL